MASRIEDEQVRTRLQREVRRRLKERSGEAPSGRFPAFVRARLAENRDDLDAARTAWIEVLSGDDRSPPTAPRPPLREAVVFLLKAALEDEAGRLGLVDRVFDEIELRLDEAEFGAPEAIRGLDGMLLDVRLLALEDDLVEALDEDHRARWHDLRERLGEVPRSRQPPPPGGGR